MDAFHPDVQAGNPVPDPAWGGRIIVHIAGMPKGLNKVTENSAVVTEMQYETNDTLLFRDWESWEFVPRLAERYDVEDAVILKPEAAEKHGDGAVAIGSGEKARRILFGKVEEAEGGWIVHPISHGNPLGADVTVAADDVLSVERDTVFTLHLHDGVKWHDGHPFDADDVFFSWDVYNNPEVMCDETRPYYLKIIHGDVLDRLTVRFFYDFQYFKALETVAQMPIIPRHLYDLTDPDNQEYHPEVHAELRQEHGDEYVPTMEDRGDFVDRNPHNQGDWIGTGPYRITAWDQQYIKAERFDDYWDKDNPEYAGYLDTVWWHHIPSDDLALQALLNGQLDLFARVEVDDYFGAATQSARFKKNFYKGYFYLGNYGYTAWNLLKPQFQDQRVRHALAHAFDLQEFNRSQYKNLAIQVTGPQNYFDPGYDRSVKPLAHDPDRAEELLAEAGWYDRDGDEIIDKDGIPFEFDLLYPSGNALGQNFGLQYQESLARLGIKMNLRHLEWATFLDRLLDREYDAAHLGWAMPLESDPEQLWHSRWGQPERRSSNHPGVMDPHVDELIERGQKELDPEKRAAVWHQLHAHLYDMQPYLFMLNTPRTFAMTKRIRGFQTFKIAPGYSLRRLFYPAGAPGTRPTRDERP